MQELPSDGPETKRAIRQGQWIVGLIIGSATLIFLPVLADWIIGGRVSDGFAGAYGRWGERITAWWASWSWTWNHTFFVLGAGIFLKLADIQARLERMGR